MMKRTYYKIFFLAVLLQAMNLRCGKRQLDIPSPTAQESSYFLSEYAFKSAIVGVYATLTDYYSSSNVLAGGAWEGEVTWLAGDDCTNGTSQPFEDFKGLQPSTGLLADFWASSYLLLGRSNVVLDQVLKAKAGVFTTPGLQNANTGEMLFLRGFAHYQLWNVFGTAPLDTLPTTSFAQLNKPSSKGTQLLDQAIADLSRAAPLLPSSWDAANTGRVTSNSAWAMLGKCLVFRATVTKSNADYQAALTAFSNIGGAVSLTANFEDNFDVSMENNSESLFEFQAGGAIAGQGATNAWLSNDQANIGVASSYWQCFTPGNGTYMGGNLYYATGKLAGAFDPADPRLPLTFNKKDSTITKYVLKDKGEGGVNSLNNTRILRYADVLLLKAEATLQSGGSTAAAIGYIDSVRARARNMVTGGTVPANLDIAQTDKNTIMQWIMDERLRELACEGVRWYDIRRWTIGGIIAPDNNFFSSREPSRMGFDATKLNWPIPQTETSKNPNITQNPY